RGRVDGRVLLSTAGGRTEEERQRVLERLAVVQGGIPGEHFRQSVARWFSDGFRQAHPELIQRHAARNMENDPRAYAAAYRVLATTDLAGELGGIRAPTLIVTGEGDTGSNPRMARLMHERIPGAQPRVLPGLRHPLLVGTPGLRAPLLRGLGSVRGA